MKRAEIIIACRDELEQNLQKTVAGITAQLTNKDGVCVVYDGEQSVKYNLPKRVRTLRPYKTARGCGQARHAGIVTSEAEIVVLIDGHMTFSDGWLKAIVDHHELNKRDVSCCVMNSLGHDWKPIPGQDGYNGGYVCIKSKEVGNQHWAIASKWLPAIPTGSVVGSVLGACYGMRREWYIEIGQPLRLLEAWGGDEELLSLASWMSGGRCYCLPIEVGHIYAAPRIRREPSDDEKAKIWSNRYAILDAIPMPKETRADLKEWLGKNRLSVRSLVEENHKRQQKIALNIRKSLARKNGLSWEQMVEQGIICEEYNNNRRKPDLMKGDKARNQVVPQLPPPAQAARATVIPRPKPKASVCPLCDWAGFDGKCKRCGHRPKEINEVKNLSADRVFRRAVSYSERHGRHNRIERI